MNALEQSVMDYQRDGWILLSQTANTAQLRKPKKGFSCLPNLLCTILFFVGVGIVQKQNGWGVALMLIGAVYPVLYFLGYILGRLGRERVMSLFMDEQGMVQRR